MSRTRSDRTSPGPSLADEIYDSRALFRRVGGWVTTIGVFLTVMSAAGTLTLLFAGQPVPAWVMLSAVAITLAGIGTVVLPNLASVFVHSPERHRHVGGPRR